VLEAYSLAEAAGDPNGARTASVIALT
jgi:hypothetical protein